MYFRLNGVAVRGRSVDDTEVSCPHERELQGTGNRGSSECEGIDIDLHLSELLLDPHAKLLFLIDDQ